MRSAVRDREILMALRPVDVIGYLRAGGWVQETVVSDRASIWVKGPNGSVAGEERPELFVPDRWEAADYPLRIAELLAVLEAVEERSQDEIVQDVSRVSTDVFRIRSFGGGGADTGSAAGDGTISLEDGARLVQHAWEMILAAACSTVSPRAFWPRRKPAKAMEYMERVRMGQTERGSYVLTIHSPVPPELRTTAAGAATSAAAATGTLSGPPPAEEPFERRVMETLTKAIGSVQAAAKQAVVDGSLEPFRRAIPDGASANFCDALAGLGEIHPTHSMEFSIAWARNRGRGGARWSGRVSPDLVPVIQEASRLFRETEPREEFELLGFIERLDRSINAARGTATVVTLMEESWRKVQVELGEQEYQLAVRAHGESIRIRMVGILTKDGRSYKLKDPMGFELAPVRD